MKDKKKWWRRELTERERERVHFTCGQKVFVCLAAEERSSQNRKRQFELSEFTVWCDTFLLMDVYNKRMNVKLLDVFFKWCLIHVFFAPFSLFILEKRLFSPLLSLFIFFALQMVRAVHAKDCGRRLDAARFSHCCHRHLRWNAAEIL